MCNNIIAYDLESHPIAIKCYFGMWQPHVWCFLQWQACNCIFVTVNNNLGEHEHLLKHSNKVFDLVPVCETRITNKTSITFNINLKNHFFGYTHTKSTAGGTPLYIANHLFCKPNTHHNLHKRNHLESAFIKLIVLWLLYF